eukprot:CAMPEP_0182428732 /NCGR_PEP_ID=MMETSP1167-20130531/23263_1 /TAXON_ID=2988 /ORGANISM="Mallomonas Sp, Strain CCMP3275" /LENGTH=143 /DNA_ID=CAMNT_0024611785 /DNA_START=247 /DNA_END=676 /DNA_ORIENTATION=-
MGIDDDSAELNCESSASVSRAKAAAEEARRKAEEEAKRKAEEEAKRKAEEEAKRKAEEEAARIKAEAKAKAEVKPEVKAVVKAPQGDESGKAMVVPDEKGRTTGFDLGLAVLFPLMIAGLGFFLFFPVIGAQLFKDLPPPPSP